MTLPTPNTTAEIKIIAEPQRDPAKCKFTLDRSILEAGSFNFKNKEEAQKSDMAKALFDIQGVSGVFINYNSLVITQSGLEDWRVIGKQIGAAIRGVIASGAQVISPKLYEILPSEEEIKSKINKILTDQINPSVASHGGNIELIEVRKNDVFLKMSGGCQGCASSAATLKQGVEEAFRREIPLLGSVFDLTDHAAGSNPYF